MKTTENCNCIATSIKTLKKLKLVGQTKLLRIATQIVHTEITQKNCRSFDM